MCCSRYLSAALPRSLRQGSRSAEPPVVFGRLGLFCARLTLPAWLWHPPRLREPVCQAQLVGGSEILRVLCMGSGGCGEQRSLSHECRRATCVALCAAWWLWNTFYIFLFYKDPLIMYQGWWVITQCGAAREELCSWFALLSLTCHR